MAGERPSHVLAVPRWTLIIHAIQMFLTIIILGLAAYGIRWVPYNVLVYSLVVCLCTLGVCIYMLVSSTIAHKLYNYWAFLALHIWMVIFWIVQFSLVASLAAIWASPSCSYSPYYGYDCSYVKRGVSIEKRDSTTYGAFWGALVAGSVFGAFEFILWLTSLIILGIYLHRHRVNGNPSAPPPIYTAPNNNQAVPMEKYNQNAQPQQYPQTPQSQNAQPVQQPQGQYAQQAQGQYMQQPQQVYNQNTGPGFATPHTQHQDLINRQSTVSPVTPGGGYQSPPQNHAELASPQHTGNYSPNAAELSTQR